MNGSIRKRGQRKALRSRSQELVVAGRVKIVRGSDNVFADLGFEAPDDELAKAKLVVLIKERIKELGLTQTRAATRMRSTQPKISKILRGDVSGVSTGWLMMALLDLGKDVEICVKPGNTETGRLYVSACC